VGLDGPRAPAGALAHAAAPLAGAVPGRAPRGARRSPRQEGSNPNQLACAPQGVALVNLGQDGPGLALGAGASALLLAQAVQRTIAVRACPNPKPYHDVHACPVASRRPAGACALRSEPALPASRAQPGRMAVSPNPNPDARLGLPRAADDPRNWPGPKAWPASASLLSFFAVSIFLQALSRA